MERAGARAVRFARELAHVRRRDPLVRLLAQINRCLLWFHPLSWWLEQELASTAEEACDAAAVRELDGPERYARVLLEMADAVRRSGGRVSWQGVGIDGRGLLTRRIDCVLRADFPPEPSRARKVLLSMACAAVVVVVAACSEPERLPIPLLEDRRTTARDAQEQSDLAFRRAAEELSREQVLAFETSLATDPEDLVTRKTLLIFYSAALSGGARALQPGAPVQG